MSIIQLLHLIRERASERERERPERDDGGERQDKARDFEARVEEISEESGKGAGK